MILYNVTIGIDKALEQEWVTWMKEKHIPDVMKTGIFVENRFYKVLSNEDETTSSYCVQYLTPSIELFNKYLKIFVPSLEEEHKQKYKDRHVAFRTLLEEV